MEILAIDPGSKQSAFVIYNGESRELVEFGILPNEELVLRLDEIIAEVMVIEQIKSYGMPIGDTVLDTVLWSGRFIQAWSFRWERIPRKTIATELCGSPRSNDRNCRLELLNLWGGKSQAVGTRERNASCRLTPCDRCTEQSSAAGEAKTRVRRTYRPVRQSLCPVPQYRSPERSDLLGPIP